jgi:GTP pyrophosphokinase
MEKEARKYRVSLKDIKDDDVLKIAGEYGLGKVDDLMAALGYGKYSAKSVLGKLVPEGTPSDGEEQPSGIGSVVRRVFGGDTSAIKVRGHDDLLVYRARCCNPIRGEEIVGYVTRGKGVAVHSRNCPNVENLLYEPERRIAVEWTSKEPKISTGQAPGYPVKLTVLSDDRAGVLKNITAVISDDNTNIRNIEARTADGYGNIDLVIDINDVGHLNRIITGLRKIAGVRDVQRVQKL